MRSWFQLPPRHVEDDDDLRDMIAVIVTPTLVRRSPGPKTWIVGTLAPIDSVDELLASALGEPIRPLVPARGFEPR